MAPRLLIFASGTPQSGGSGFRHLVGTTRTGALDANIVGVVSNHKDGGVRAAARNLDIPFIHFPPPHEAAEYRMLVEEFEPDFVACSGWLKMVRGLDPRTTFNIHPGPLPEFGGPGMYGHHVHEAVLEAYRHRKITRSAVSMHFVTDEYDQGPVFFRHPVEIEPGDTRESLGIRVNAMEHEWQAKVTNEVLAGRITWDGKNPESLVSSML